MVNVNDVLKFVNFVTNKETDGNTMTAEQYNTLLKSVNMDFFKYRYGLPERYQAGQPLPPISWEVTQKITDALRAFKVRTGVDIAAVTLDNLGRWTIPSNYVHYSSIGRVDVTSVACDEFDEDVHDIEVLSDAQVNGRLANSITKPTAIDPCCVFYNSYIQFYPKNISGVTITYLRMPVTPVYGYTLDVNDEQIYNPATSVHFEYPEDCFTDIARMVLSYNGINLREQDVIQYAEMQKIKGV